MLGPSLRRGVSLLTVLLACAPTKEDGSSGDTSLDDTGAATLGHSSAPTSGAPETTVTPTSSASATGTPPDPSTTTTTTTTGEPQPTTITTTVTTVPGGPTEGSADGDGVPFDPEESKSFITFPDDLPPGECDPWSENCPAGQKCMPFATPGSPTWDAVKCVNVVADARAPGEPCTVFSHPTSGIDDCQHHAMCWDVDAELHGTCVAMCIGDGFNSMFCANGNTCVKANDNVILVCLARCEPLLADCPEDQVCLPAGPDFACAPDASGTGGQAFTPCEVGNGCDPGLICDSSDHSVLCANDSAECCLPVCDLEGPDSCPPGTACKDIEFPKFGICADP